MRNIQFPVTKLQLINLQNTYHTDYKIAKVLNLSIARISQLRKKYNIPIYNIKKDNYKRDRFIYNSFVENKTKIKQLASQNDLSIMTIRRIIKSFQEKK